MSRADKLDDHPADPRDAVLDTTFQPGDPGYYRCTNGKRAFIVGRIVAVDAPQRFPIRNNCSCATTRRLAFVNELEHPELVGRSRALRADPEVQQALRDVRVDRLREPSLAESETLEALRTEAFDPTRPDGAGWPWSGSTSSRWTPLRCVR